MTADAPTAQLQDFQYKYKEFRNVYVPLQNYSVRGAMPPSERTNKQ